MQTKHRGNAYFKHGKECVYSFHDAEFDTTDAAIQLVYTSKQKCKADPTKNFKFIIEGTCAEQESELKYDGMTEMNDFVDGDKKAAPPKPAAPPKADKPKDTVLSIVDN